MTTYCNGDWEGSINESPAEGDSLNIDGVWYDVVETSYDTATLRKSKLQLEEVRQAEFKAFRKSRGIPEPGEKR